MLDIIVKKLLKDKKATEENVGFDAKNGKWVDMIESGIIDPTKVTRNALMNASSISALFLTTEAGVAKSIKKNQHLQCLKECINR